jgi:hypothetical protein
MVSAFTGPGVTASRPEGGPEQLPVPQQESAPAGSNEIEATGRAGGSVEDGNAKRQVADRGLDLEQVEAEASCRVGEPLSRGIADERTRL